MYIAKPSHLIFGSVEKETVVHNGKQVGVHNSVFFSLYKIKQLAESELLVPPELLVIKIQGAETKV